MKRVITTAGLAALGLLSANAQSSTQTAKPWSVSAALKGFYDDNYATRKVKEGSGGFDVAPSVSFNHLAGDTSVSLVYNYDLRYYFDRGANGVNGSTGKDDQSHEVTGKLSHSFSPRLKLDISDSFASAQEPQILNRGNGAPGTQFLRLNGNNIRNFADAKLTLQITEKLGAVASYNNDIYDFEQEGKTDSNSARLDRMEHLASFDLQYEIQKETIGVLGYKYGVTSYTEKADKIGLVNFNGVGVAGASVNANTRDQNYHFFLAGVDQTFANNISAQVRGGVQLTEYKSGTTKATPYGTVQANYAYSPGSTLALGVRHQTIPTDVTAVDLVNGLTQSQEATTVYGAIHHKITAKLSADVSGQYQNSVFQLGSANNLEDNYYMAGVSLGYELNKFLALEAGYNFDRLESQLLNGGRGYSRNRVYAGIRASY